MVETRTNHRLFDANAEGGEVPVAEPRRCRLVAGAAPPAELPVAAHAGTCGR
jgi:hypothetical protein